MEELTCPAPLSVPKHLARPGPGYKRSLAGACLALLGFIAIYLSLTGWFVWSAYRLFMATLGDGGSGDGIAPLIGAVAMAVLAIFMLKALFFRDRQEKPRAIEITPTEEPLLFPYLHRIADQAGAPRPHRVFLSTKVNAGVFYDLSILNLIFPSKKNLEIGLGLINALTLGEVRAVLAHEFGHFAQGAMAVGRWVHVAQRVAAHIVHKRDYFDSMLHGLSAIDIRIAWIGWIFRVVIWALRAVLDSAFFVVVRAQRTLDHEMERQADLVAVTLTGSDALVNALHKLGAADVAFDQALDVAAGRHARGEAVDDLFALQTRVLEHGRRVLADATHGVAPPLPAEGRAQHRLFERRIAHPPRMWSSHPPNHEREDNIKRTYVPCDLDDRPAWLLFAAPDATRARITQAALATQPQPQGEVRRLTREESLAAVDLVFEHPYFDPRFRGVYLGRSSVRGAKTPADLYLPPERAGELALDELYPASLRDALGRWKALEVEVQSLVGLQRGILQTGGAEIQFRGQTLRRQELPKTLETVRAECAAARAALEQRDREHRSAHLAAAERVGMGWPEYLRSLAALLHYADHTEADLRDARGYVANVVAIAMADGRVSDSERGMIAGASNDVYMAMKAVWEQRAEVLLPPEIAEALGVERWAAALHDEFQLGAPHHGNIGAWIDVVDGWLDGFIGPLDALERRTLAALLRAEEKVAGFARDPASVTPAPAPAAVPAKYATLEPGTERERQWRLGWWDRFQTADGVLPSIARFVVAGGLVAATVLVGAMIGGSKLVVYNGLGHSVVVHVVGRTLELPAFSKASLDDLKVREVHVVTETATGEPLETFDASLGSGYEQYVYNVAGAAALARSTAVYGAGTEPDPARSLGAERWTTTDATVLFEKPPQRVSSSRSTKLAVLWDRSERSPEDALSNIPAEDRARVIRLHATWDDPRHATTMDWLHRATKLPTFAAILAARLARDPRDVLALRAEQDQPNAAAKAAACARHQGLSVAAPADTDLQYLAIRCRPVGPGRDDAFVAAYDATPSNRWLASAAGIILAGRSEWERALAAWSKARETPGASERLTIDSARVLRLMGSEREAEVQKLAASSPYLTQMFALEDAKDMPPRGPAVAYFKLSYGALDEALAAIDERAPDRARIVRLIAASRGATTEQLAAARALPAGDGVDYHTIWPAIGLALRSKEVATSLIARMKDFVDPEDLPHLEQFLHPDRLVDDQAAERAAISTLGPVERGHAYELGVVILGDAAPQAWRDQARALLFAPERPFL